MDTYKKYKDQLIDIYEEFLDKNFKGWDWSDTAQKYLFQTPFLQENSISPNIEIAFKESIKACSSVTTIPEKQKKIKDTCKQYGLKITPKKINNIIDYTEKMRYAPIMYFEEKIFQAVPLYKIKCLIVPKEISEDFIDKLKENNIPYQTYDTLEKRKDLIVEYSKNNMFEKTLDNVLNECDVKVDRSLKSHNTQTLER